MSCMDHSPARSGALPILLYGVTSPEEVATRVEDLATGFGEGNEEEGWGEWSTEDCRSSYFTGHEKDQ